tara:strand:- start:1 stop:606 length:606 start_codon:yes stop_codon:yes gene_type:complete
MVISWQGFNNFKLKNTKTSIILNPYSLDGKKKLTKSKTDIILFSNPQKIKESKIDKEAFIIFSPGEYEVSDVFIYGKEIDNNIIYYLLFDGLKITFLGEFGHKELNNEDLELIEGSDILILPVGGGELTNSKEAVKIISQVEPRIVIPSCYQDGTFNLKTDDLSVFIKEFGIKAEQVDKLKIFKKDLPQNELKLITLSINK